MAACRQLEQQLGACTRLGEQQLAGCRQPAMAMGQLGLDRVARVACQSVED